MIDTHCHIDDPQYAEDLDAFLHLQQSEGVERILVPGVDASSIEPVDAVCARYPDYLFPAIGLHPENVQADWEEQLATIHAHLLKRNAQAQRHYIAIGEIGLDYHFDTTYKQQQHQALRMQLQWATEMNLPVMIHVRDATEDSLNILGEFPHLRGVIHCFSGSNEVAKELVRRGFYLGIGGVITFKNSKLRHNLTDIPLTRLVLETDAPYMAPVPHRGERNESRWMHYVAETLAEVYHLPVEDIDRVTTDNAKALFDLK